MEYREPPKPAGIVTLRLSGSVTTDAWADYKHRWGSAEKVSFEVVDADHMAHCIGVHLSDLAVSLLAEKHICGDRSSCLKAVARAFADVIDEEVHAIWHVSEEDQEATDGPHP
jgi:hypothetical protein